MNLRDLRYLVALADHKHFGRAAAASFVSQPTLSTQIRKLEDELGVTLVERSPRKLMLTDAGRAVTERARSILREADEMREIARRTRDPESGTVRLGLFPTLGPYLLPHVVPRIRARFPRLELLLIEEKTPVLVKQLLEGKLDAACLALPVDDPQLHAEFLFEEPFVLAVPAGHPLAKRGALKLEDLEAQSLLLLEDGHCLREQALDVCALAGASERAGFRATSLETLRQMVAAGVGATLLPTLAVKPPVAPSDDVALVRFRDEAPSRRIALVWRRSSGNVAFLAKLAALLRDLPKGLLDPRATKVRGETGVMKVGANPDATTTRATPGKDGHATRGATRGKTG
jgi:LysR family transcriptional regulator, hydrogen peroxide-inducible genes activator